jgi:hypothetical protein
MPCYEPPRNPRAVEADCARRFRHNSPVAEMLCEAMTLLEVLCPVGVRFSPQLLQWWKEHNIRDAIRRAIETATGQDLDAYGSSYDMSRFQYTLGVESDADFRKRVLQAFNES